MNPIKIVMLLLLAPAFCLAQNDAGMQKQTAVTKDFIALYNTGDTTQYRNFINASNAPDASHFMEQMGHEHGFIGAVTPRDVQIISPTETQTLAQSEHFEAWWQVIVITDSQQRYKEHHMRLIRVTDAVLRDQKLTDAQISAGIDSFIRQQSAAEPFNGNVVVQRRGETLYRKSFGTTNNGQPHVMSDKMDLASVGKLFTAISILQLVDAGKLKLEDSIGKLLPEIGNKALAAITVQQLLTHTSGMGDFFEDPQYQHVLDSTKAAFASQHVAASAPALHLAYFKSDALRFAPGTGWAYSNTGFELLGYLIEKLSQQPYTSYVAQNILKPSGMTATEPGSGAGGGRSTVDDLTRFGTALQSAKLLSKTRTEQFMTYTVNGQYGWGSEHQTLAGETIVGHSGGFEKVCNEVNLYQKSGYTVIILSNSNPPFGHFLSDKIKMLLLQKQ